MTQAILTVSNFLQDGLNGLVDLFSNWKRARARKAKARQTYRELNNLTDYELRDLGFNFSKLKWSAPADFPIPANRTP